MKKVLFTPLLCLIFALGYTQTSNDRIEYFSVKENLSKDVVFNWRISPSARDYKSAEIWGSHDGGNNWYQIVIFWTNSPNKWKYHPTLPKRINILQYQLVLKYKSKPDLESPIRKITVFWKNPVPKKEMKTPRN